MTGPRAPEARAATLAKRRETMRRRPLAELREMVDQTAVAFRHYGPDVPREADLVGWVFSQLAFEVLGPRRLSEEGLERLDQWAHALHDVLHPERPLVRRMVVSVDSKGMGDLRRAIEKRTLAVAVANELAHAEFTDLKPGDEDTVSRLLQGCADEPRQP